MGSFRSSPFVRVTLMNLQYSLRYPRSEPNCMTRPVSEHDQPHIRSPFTKPADGRIGSTLCPTTANPLTSVFRIRGRQGEEVRFATDSRWRKRDSNPRSPAIGTMVFARTL